MKRVFVTGAAGFIGRHLCRQLIAEGIEIVTLSRPSGASRRQNGRADEPHPKGVTPVYGDLLDEESYGPALKGCSHVFHLAGNPRFDNDSSHQVTNTQGTAALLRAVRDHAPGLERFVFVSSMGTIDRHSSDSCRVPLNAGSIPSPTSAYGKSKAAAERLVADSGFPHVIVRPGMVVGPDMRFTSHVAVFARMALEKSLLSRFDWPGQVSVVHVEDLVSALMLAARDVTAAGDTFFVGGDTIAIGRIFAAASPGRRFGLRPLAAIVGGFPRPFPFRLKVLCLSALTVDDGPIRRLGWKPGWSADAAVAEVVEREKIRADFSRPPPGYALVTGAASGLGRAMAEELAGRGRRLILVDKDHAGLSGIARAGGTVERLFCDLSEADQMARLLESPEIAGRRIDEIYLCAGIGDRGPFARSDIDLQRRMIDVNVSARLWLVRRLLPAMIERQFGRIVIISSSAAFQPLPFMSVYAASNAALLSFGEALSCEVASDGVAVLTVCPGGMDTGFQKASGVRRLEGEKLAAPADVARGILSALAREQSLHFSSVRSSGMAIAARLLPRWASRRLWHRLMSRMR